MTMTISYKTETFSGKPPPTKALKDARTTTISKEERPFFHRIDFFVTFLSRQAKKILEEKKQSSETIRITHCTSEKCAKKSGGKSIELSVEDVHIGTSSDVKKFAFEELELVKDFIVEVLLWHSKDPQTHPCFHLESQRIPEVYNHVQVFDILQTLEVMPTEEEKASPAYFIAQEQEESSPFSTERPGQPEEEEEEEEANIKLEHEQEQEILEIGLQVDTTPVIYHPSDVETPLKDSMDMLYNEAPPVYIPTEEIEETSSEEERDDDEDEDDDEEEEDDDDDDDDTDSLDDETLAQPATSEEETHNNTGSKKHRVLRKSNSTSSLYIRDTISKPNITVLMRCVSTKLLSWIEQGFQSGAKSMLPDFDERRALTRYKPNFSEVPPFREVVHFVNLLFKLIPASSPEPAIMCIVYIQRFIDLTGCAILPSNWRQIFMTAFFLAIKIWEDKCIWNIDFIEIFPFLSLHEVNHLEKKLLLNLEFNVTLTASEYAVSFFALRELSDHRDAFVEPLNEEGVHKLELSSATSSRKFAKQIGNRSATLTSLMGSPSRGRVVLS